MDRWLVPIRAGSVQSVKLRYDGISSHSLAAHLPEGARVQMKVTFYHPKCTIHHWGYIPSFLFEEDLRPAKEQFNDRYPGGWQPFNGFTKDEENRLHYPGDPVQFPVSEIQFRNERIILYQHDWVCIIQPDGTWEVCRMD
jgi:hypothetical protein